MAQRLAASGILEVEKERLKQLKVFLPDTARSGKVPLLPKQKNEGFFFYAVENKTNEIWA